jgi:HTH-type transcriptional regulator/antitoxin HigA
LAELLSFFRVSSPAAFERQWLNPGASFRSSPVFTASPKAVAAWLRWGEIEAERVPSEQFDAGRFQRVLNEIRPLTRRGPFMQILDKVKALCAEAGVVVVLTPEFKGIHLSGATRWIAGRAVIQLSVRHKTDDQFWFSFFHEAGHILRATRRQEFIDGADHDVAASADADEEEANDFARDSLLPPHDFQVFLDHADFSASAIRSFAQAQRVSPGIVVGRLQRDRLLPRSHLNDLKRQIDWPTSIGLRS